MLLQEVEPEFLDCGWVIPVLEMTTIVVVVAMIAVSKSVFSRLSSSL